MPLCGTSASHCAESAECCRSQPTCRPVACDVITEQAEVVHLITAAGGGFNFGGLGAAASTAAATSQPAATAATAAPSAPTAGFSFGGAMGIAAPDARCSTARLPLAPPECAGGAVPVHKGPIGTDQDHCIR